MQDEGCSLPHCDTIMIETVVFNSCMEVVPCQRHCCEGRQKGSLFSKHHLFNKV